MVYGVASFSRGGVMSQAHQTQPDLSQVELLLDQQKYQEALVPLAQLIEENPWDLQIRLYRLLAVRLLILNQMISDGSSRTLRPDRLNSSEPLAKPAATLRNIINFCSTRWPYSVPQSIGSLSPTSLIKRVALAIGLAALFVTPVSFCLSVPEQQPDGANKQSFYVPNGFAGITGKGAERAHRQDHAVAQIRPVLGSNGDDAKVRIATIPPHTASNRKSPPIEAASAGAIELFPKQPSRPVRELQTVYKTRGPLSLRREPRFASTSLQQMAEGTHIRVLGTNGNWLRVRPDHSDAVGYLRKEFVVPAGTIR
jgi:hypothetical protein